MDLSSPARSLDRELTPDRKESKTRSKPSITPRTFKRFFTPRSSLGQIGRETLGEITFSGTNARKRRVAAKTFDVSWEVDENAQAFSDDSLPKRCPQVTLIEGVDDRSPKRQKNAPNEGLELSRTFEAIEERPVPLMPIQRCKARHSLGDCLRRELGAAPECYLGSAKMESVDSRFETARIYTRPEDVHVCKGPSTSNRTLPFCATACNSSLYP